MASTTQTGKSSARFLRRAQTPHWECQVSYLSNVVSQRPMLRTSAEFILAFCCAAPVVWLFSNLVVYSLRSLFR
jgi:hypothetical protein